MPNLPRLERTRKPHPGCDGSLVFAVYAPFGSDPALSRHPSKTTQAPIEQQELLAHLQYVASKGVNVSALVDLYRDDTWLVEIPARAPKRMSIVSAWKQDMSSPRALAGFLRRVHQRFPRSHLVLSLEGHGAGFLPELDHLRLGHDDLTQARSGSGTQPVKWTQTPQGVSPSPADAAPTLPLPYEVLPPGSPGFPVSSLPISTWGLAEALRSAIQAGVPRPLIVNFANCFNASVEHLATMGSCAEYATGYANYDYFTAGITYRQVFDWLVATPGASVGALARQFALANRDLLEHKKNHPSVGATVPLRSMGGIVKAVNELARQLTGRMAGKPDRLTVRDAIQLAARNAQQYDTNQNMDLEVPDQFMDIGSFAARIEKTPLFAGTAVQRAALDVLKATKGLWQYGSVDRPYMNTGQTWDFSDQALALNIFFPDPQLEGIWDWRSPYYMAGEALPDAPPAIHAQIDFLRTGGGVRAPWPAFIEEYHRDIKFQQFLPALRPLFPTFEADFKPDYRQDGGNQTGRPPTTKG